MAANHAGHPRFGVRPVCPLGPAATALRKQRNAGARAEGGPANRPPSCPAALGLTMASGVKAGRRRRHLERPGTTMPRGALPGLACARPAPPRVSEANRRKREAHSSPCAHTRAFASFARALRSPALLREGTGKLAHSAGPLAQRRPSRRGSARARRVPRQGERVSDWHGVRRRTV